MRHRYGEPCIRYGKHRSVCLQQKSRRVCDSFSVFMLADGKQEMIYKHAISTIMPSTPVKLS